MDPAGSNKDYQSLQQLMIAKGDLKAVDVDSSSQSIKKNGGETKQYDNLNMVQRMYILAATVNEDAANDPNFDLANKIDNEDLKVLK